ncbi:tail fiber protein [Flammeovirga kamogawensis]|uniref:Tail fiber protein n=1 Tax=Flammeovirga kamogawensis TaxID=373891 RepID=A0ABX8GRY6_9BACT|nr:tail fiber protein [Flammeovirga kamogawensis]MBB6464089.1 microcystin-dependent protein [Flammeovirga kamogawensis]QWG06184.1 tail fiber protein [Flammeovirga kamogawensis]TRX68015.1 hypothetical protein EO216_07645 [Flammeovirga kamogawensis]
MLLKTQYLNLLLLITLTLSSGSLFAQDSGGLVIQGIARNSTNIPIPNKLVHFKFRVTNSNNTINYYTESEAILTDAQGVFAHVIGNGSNQTGSLANIPYEKDGLMLTISMPVDGSENIISQQKFNYVPYAYSALNGAPSGTIISYVGSTAPDGWMLCDGSNVPNGTALKDIIGLTKSPDLRGIFLRGTGTNTSYKNSSDAFVKGPSLNGYQKDKLRDHGHDNDISVSLSNAGSHNHDYNKLEDNSGTDVTGYAAGVNKRDNFSRSTGSGGSHSHTATLSGSIGDANGGAVSTETRPINYGVTYIIKL